MVNSFDSFKLKDILETQPITSATRQVRQQWFSVCIFPLGLLFGLTGNRPQSAPACSFLRWLQFSGRDRHYTNQNKDVKMTTPFKYAVILSQTVLTLLLTTFASFAQDLKFKWDYNTAQQYSKAQKDSSKWDPCPYVPPPYPQLFCRRLSY